MSCSSFRTLIPPGIVSVLPVAHALTKLWRTHTGIGRLPRLLRWQTMTGSTFVARTRRCTWLKHAASPETIVVSAIVGAAGLRPTLRAIELGASVALANKETMVCAGVGPAGTQILSWNIVAGGFRTRCHRPMLAGGSF